MSFHDHDGASREGDPRALLELADSGMREAIAEARDDVGAEVPFEAGEAFGLLHQRRQRTAEPPVYAVFGTPLIGDGDRHRGGNALIAARGHARFSARISKQSAILTSQCSGRPKQRVPT